MAVLTTFAVESIDETLRKVVEMGGRMHSYVFKHDSVLLFSNIAGTLPP